MSNAQFESFIASILAQNVSSSYFWNLVSLAKGDLARFHAPKTEDEFFAKVKTQKDYSPAQQHQDKILQDLYENLDSPYVQDCLQWVLYLVPLVVPSDIVPFVLEGTPYYESDCYNSILCDIKKITNPKLEYRILSGIINKYRGKQMPIDILMAYEVATFYRSRCKYASVQKPEIQEARIQDLRVFMGFAKPAESKLDSAERITDILMNRLQKTILKSDDEQYVAHGVKHVCDLAKEYATEAGPENQKFIDRVGDVFNHRTIMEIPSMIQRLCNNNSK